MSNVNESGWVFDAKNKLKGNHSRVLEALQPANGYVFSKVLDEASKSFKLYSVRTSETWMNYLKNECNQLENQLDVIAPREASAIKQQLNNDFFKPKNEEMVLINKVVYLKFMTALYQKDKSNKKEFDWWFDVLYYIYRKQLEYPKEVHVAKMDDGKIDSTKRLFERFFSKSEAHKQLSKTKQTEEKVERRTKLKNLRKLCKKSINF